MAPPDAETIKAARDDMKGDSKRWDEASDVMESARQQAANLGLTSFHFGYLPTEQGFVKKYGELQDLVTRLLSEGKQAMSDMSSALTQSLDDYDRADVGAGEGVRRAGTTK